MIPILIKRFDANRDKIRSVLKTKHHDYNEIVKVLVQHITVEDGYGECSLDPERITKIDHGDYQGTLIFVIASKGYQPADYWATEVAYGSCSGCDTLEAIRSDYEGEGDTVSDKQADDYLTLALHFVQKMEKLFDRGGNQ
jgi:hypothetical protein